MAMIENNNSAPKCSIFETGKFETRSIKVKKSDDSSPPVDLFLAAPVDEGTYPVLLFCHSYCTKSSWYSQLLQYISSHGYIVVAPQFYLYHCLLISMNDEIKKAAKVTNWLTKGLSLALPEKVKPDLSNLALMGHSRGGKIAFSLAMGHAPTSLKFQALLTLDPVSWPSPPTWIEPRILTYVPHSFQLSIPVCVIGTGLSNQTKGIMPPLCPDGFNHAEFFNESKPPCCYFLAKDYGHCDVLDESKASLASLLCKSGKGSKEKMRRGVGGIVVAFLKAYLGNESEHLDKIVDASTAAPITLDPVIYLRE